MRIKEVDSYSDFIALRERWKDVLRRCDHSVFSTWEWLSIWWKHFRKDKRLILLLAEDNDNILGISPLMYSVHKMFGLRIGKIEFLGTPASDYSDFILAEKGEECIKRFMDYVLNSLSEEWDCIELTQIPETAEFLMYLNRISGNARLVPIRVFRHPLLFSFNLFVGKENAKLVQRRVLCECPYIPLTKSFDTFFNRLPRKFRKELRRNRRRLQEKYKVGFEDFSKPESCKEGMKRMFDLHQKRWTAKGWPGIFADQKVRDFHLDVARSFSEKGWLSLDSLLAKGKDVASLYGFRYKSKLYAYLSGIDPAYHRYSVGNLLYLHILENCIKDEFTEFDFLRGGELYKYRWTSLSRKNFEVVLTQRGFLSWIHNWLGREYWSQGKRLKYFLKMQ